MTKRTASAQGTPRPASAAVAPSLRVSIGALRLPGMNARDADRLAATFRGELAARLVGTTPAEGLERDLLTIDRFAVAPNEAVEDTGRRLAVAVANALTAPAREPRR